MDIIMTFFLLLFVIGFVNNLLYLKAVKSLLAYLQSNYGERLSGLDMPAGLMDSSPARVKGLLKFLKNPEYFNDDNLKKLKDEALKYYRTGIIIFGILFTILALLFIFEFISK